MDEPGLQCPDCRAGKRQAATKKPDGEQVDELNNPPGLFPFPGRVHLELPWSALASDNLRKGVAGAANRENQARYREAMAHARSRVRAQYSGEPFQGPAQMHAKFYVPNDARRDITNFTKLVLDALVGIVLSDDRWQVLRSITWEACGIDVDRPRCEIMVERSG